MIFSKANGMVPELLHKNVPESLYIRNMGTNYPWLPGVYQILGTSLP